MVATCTTCCSIRHVFIYCICAFDNSKLARCLYPEERAGVLCIVQIHVRHQRVSRAKLRRNAFAWLTTCDSRHQSVSYFQAKATGHKTRATHKKCKSDLLRSPEAKSGNDIHFMRNPFSVSLRRSKCISESESGEGCTRRNICTPSLHSHHFSPFPPLLFYSAFRSVRFHFVHKLPC